MPYFVYLLRCEDGSIYTGITTSLPRRFAEHGGLGGRGAKYTANHHPLRFERAWKAKNRSEASRLEYRVKRLSHREKENLILGEVPERLDLSPYFPLKITEEGRILTMLFLCYSKCSTCKKAQSYLESKEIPLEIRDIKAEPPTKEELREWYGRSGLPLKRFFNTSGLQYKALGLSKKLPEMTEEEQLALLATDGMLVKRPILVGEDKVLVGFREADWEAAL